MANRTHKSSQKLSQAEYRRHIFNQSRGVKEGAASSRADLLYGDQPWYKPDRSLGELYEQENSVKNWGNLDSTDRRNYRAAELKEVRRLVRESVGKHPGTKGRDKSVVDSVVDAYVNGKPLPDSLTDSEREAWGKILDESAANAIEGKELPKRWSEAQSKAVQAEGTQTGVAANPAAGGGVPTNGQRQVHGGSKDDGAPKPIPPRQRPAAQPLAVGTVGEYSSSGIATDSHVRVAGAPLDIRNTKGQTALSDMQADQLKTGAIRAAEERRRAQSDAQTSEVDRLQARNWERFRQDQNRQALSDARSQFREKQRAALMEKRYNNRSFRDADDWKNLGTLREGEQMLDEKTYDEKVGDLVKRARKLRSAEGRAGLGSTDLRDMDMVFKTVGKLTTEKREDGTVKYGGNLTPAQIEALEKRVSGFENHAAENRARTTAQAQAYQRRAADDFRQAHGLQGFSDEDVLAARDKHRQKTANAALDRILKLGSNPSGQDPRVARKYEEDWDVIRRNMDVTSVFNRAMEDKGTKDKYLSDILDIGTGPGSDIRQAELRRAAIINQMIKERHSGDADTVTEPVGQWKQPTAQQPTAQQPTAQQPTVQQPTAQQPPENLVPGLPPRKKAEDTQAAALGGTALRPRVRR